MNLKKIICILAVSSMALAVSACGSKTPENSGNPEGTAPQTGSGQTANNSENQNSNSSDTQNPENTSDKITEEKAKEIALKNAGLKENDVTSLHIKLDMDNGVDEYEVNFYAGGKEYDYDIEAATGKIRSSDIDIDDDHQKNASVGNEKFGISIEKAKKIVLSKVKGANENNLRIHKDMDDGRAVYEGEIVHNNKKYEFELDGSNGDVLEWDVE